MGVLERANIDSQTSPVFLLSIRIYPLCSKCLGTEDTLFILGPPQRLVDIVHKPRGANQVNNAAALHDPPHRAVTTRCRSTGEEHSYATVAVVGHDLGQNLRARPVYRRHAVNVKDDVAVRLRAPETRQRGVCRRRAVHLEPPEPRLKLAGVGKGQGLGDLDDEAALDGLGGDLALCVLEAIRAGDAAHDLDPRSGAVADDHEERDADAQCHTEGKGVEYGGEEDECHETELGPASDAPEKGDIVGSLLH